MGLLVTEIADYLATQSVGTVATDIFIGQQPGGVDDCVTVYERDGRPADPYLPTKNPNIQIIVRNKSYETGRAKAATVFAALHQKANTDFGDNYAYYILATSDVGYIGRDENERHEWSLNFRLETRAG